MAAGPSGDRAIEFHAMEGFVKTTGVTQVTVVTSAEAEEPVSALMERLFGIWPSIYGNVETGVSAASIFSRAKPSEIRGAVPELKEGLRDLEEFGIRIAPGEVKISRVKREDWSESWKKYFKTIEVGRKLMIKPSWSKQKAKEGQAVVVLDPGLSFGTGQHATTSFCLREVVRQSGKGMKGLLDIGCGSGILAIAAAKLKFGRVEAFDFDPVAVRIAKKNCASNRVKVAVSRRDLTKMPVASRQKFDVVCANLIADLLIERRETILNRVAEGGVVVLAGILAKEFEQVRSCYAEAGWELVRTKVEREWQSGTFKKS